MIRTLINPRYKDWEAFIEVLPKNYDQLGTTIYKGRNEIKTIEQNGILLNVKSFKVPHFINKVAYAWIRGSKARHSYEYAQRMILLGANTPEPVACVEVIKNGLFQSSYYISIHHSYDFTVRDLIGFDFPDKDNILRQFAEYTYLKLHLNGIHHLDYSRGNILIRKQYDNQYDFSVVDINRMRFEKMPYLKGLRNFSHIWASEGELSVVAKKYAQLNNMNEDEAVKMLIQFDKHHKGKIRKKLALKQQLRNK